MITFPIVLTLSFPEKTAADVYSSEKTFFRKFFFLFSAFVKEISKRGLRGVDSDFACSRLESPFSFSDCLFFFLVCPLCLFLPFFR